MLFMCDVPRTGSGVQPTDLGCVLSSPCPARSDRPKKLRSVEGCMYNERGDEKPPLTSSCSQSYSLSDGTGVVLDGDCRRSYTLTDRPSSSHNDSRVTGAVVSPRSGLFSGPDRTSDNSDMALSAVMISRGGSGIRHANSSINLNILPDDNAWHQSEDSSCVRCTCDKIRGSRETVLINVGGQIFETFRTTLKRLKTCKLANDKEMMKYYRVEKGDYFFDRDPHAFNIILNYLRYGDLHLPTHLCGPALMREFQFWGIDEQDIERCCFQPYNTWKTQTKSLEKLEYDRKQSTTQTDLAQDRVSAQCWRRVRAVIWTFLQDPTSSLAAKIYAWISIIFVFMSIFSFCAETHPFFQLPPSEAHDFRTLYRIFALEESTVLTTTDNTMQADTGTRGGDWGNWENSSHGKNVSLSQNTSVVNATVIDGYGERIQHPALLIIDLMCVFFFTIEFLTRLVFCPKKVRFCTSLQNIIDFVAIVPDYIEFVLLSISPSVRQGLPFMDFIFILRMLRLFRIFRLIRHVPGLWILLYTLKASFNELLLMFVFLLIGMVVFASLMHFAEGHKDFGNIPVGFWWAVVTMTTVGYGDMFPKTSYGYMIGSLCAISGLLMIAFTVPIIVSNFVLYYTHVQYGISEKDDTVRKIGDVPDETESCSLHTSSTETSDINKRISPDSMRTGSGETARNLTAVDIECNNSCVH